MKEEGKDEKEEEKEGDEEYDDVKEVAPRVGECFNIIREFIKNG